MKEVKKDIVVLGGGLMGSSAAWQLVAQGTKVLLIEQQSSAYTFGSSFGEARICRSLGPKHDIWSWLHRQTVIEAEHLIRFLNTEDAENHSMEDIYTTSPVTYIIQTERKAGILRLLEQQDDEYSCAPSPQEAKDQFDVALPENGMLIQEYRKHSGTMNPKELIGKMHKGIRLKGGEIRYEQKIERIERTKDGYLISVTGEREQIIASNVISAAGPYSGHLLRDIFPNAADLIVPKRVALAFFSIAPDRYHSLPDEQQKKLQDFFPLINLDEEHSFAMIEKFQDGLPLIKIGGHFRRTAIEDLDNTWSMQLSTDEIQTERTRLTDYLRLLNLPLNPEDLIYQQGYSCVYSLTENEVPLITHIPQNDTPDKNFVVMGGFSGVGAKGALAYGMLAANLLLNKEEGDFMYQKVKKALNPFQKN